MNKRWVGSALTGCTVTLVVSIVLSVAAQNRVMELVAQLRDIPTPLPAAGHPDDPVEERRRTLYRELRESGEEASRALANALSDPDTGLRKHAALALSVLASRWYEPKQKSLDIRTALPNLMRALEDADSNVRGWSAQAIGQMGPDGAPAVPKLIALLANPDEGSRNSACIALRGIGPSARNAIPALELALSDPSPDVRGFAKRAIDGIKGPQ